MVFGITFKGGFHVHGHKELSNTGKFIEIPAPKIVKIPLLQHIGSPCAPVVKKGDEVKVGQLIGESTGFISSNIHSSISGKVLKVEDVSTSRGKVKTVFIENDDTYTLGFEEVDRKLEDLSSSEIVHIIESSGITGMGGASFPTQVKLNPPQDKKIDSVIVNAAECEPYLTADDTLLRNFSKEVLEGLKAAMKAVNAENGYITIEDNKPQAIKCLNDALSEENGIKVVVVKTKYPQGDEKRIIDVTLKREVPSGKLPADVGVVVINTSTSYAIYKAVYKGIPLYERLVTFTGSAMRNPQNALVKIGTPVIDAVEFIGGFTEDLGKYMLGGPMMGLAQSSVEIPIEKANNGILAFTTQECKMEEPDPCIRCGKCAEVCPVHLQPFNLEKLVSLGEIEESKQEHVMDCIECGSCSYICPSHRHLVETIRIGKNEVRKMGK